MKYFGTDGIRGKVGAEHINEIFVKKLGIACAIFLRKNSGNKPSFVIIGKDTRASGEDIENYLAQGLHSCDLINIFYAGVLPTPALAMNTSFSGANLGIMITASHNPYTDNGIKLFNSKGNKLEDEYLEEIESIIDTIEDVALLIKDNKVFKNVQEEYLHRYRDFASSLLSQNSLSGLKIVLDCANGASCNSSEFVFKSLGAQVICVSNTPDGQNINQNCGSEHPENLQKLVIENNADIGFAHDGDADRLVVCDENGQILKGEEFMGIICLYLLSKNKLKNKILVTTKQSNSGLDSYLSGLGIKVIRTDIGDRFVIKQMLETGACFGGESSGHYIFSDYCPSGDGLISALIMLSCLVSNNKKLSQLKKDITLLPKVEIALPVSQKKDIKTVASLSACIDEIEKELSSNGRLMIRYSGTENKIRLLVEAKTLEKAKNYIEKLSLIIKKTL